MNLTNHNDEYIASYWNVQGDAVKCLLCPHACILKEGEIGICRTRQHIQKKMVSIVYGYPCAVHIDPVEKKPLYHFYPSSQTLSLSTTGCNLRCLNCQNYTISQQNFNKKEYKYISPDDIVDMALVNDCHSISYTYTDPIVYYEYANDIALIAQQKGLKNIIVSAGYINKKPLREWCKYIDAANIDLKCFSDEKYLKLSKIHLKTVLNTLKVLLEENVYLEITNLIIPEYTDDLKEIKQMCEWLVDNGFSQVPLHFSKFYGTYKLKHLSATSLSTLESAYAIAKESGLNYVYLGNVQNHKTENTFCPVCNHLLIERSGYYARVLHINDGKCSYCNTQIYGEFK
ncbi:AmmeMemoRadiSam system radical SAM enzyme [Plebeiibacterium sediminum]|uniref:AmmeMemoRadiSam system radical SAM enzyme n=1 Tax=Plebeiibacterium sediminum TaxID=2992112 RepID=A0AAE3M595_9BACT|nr:AmmeMemoRadiSam system radical SAM enzyme [Plebeiobacterium sediminum]MCW3787394.1 AmmeMemoRadiSam system radical SAM enzyme [Plebeiobacterium sediminum]